MAKVARKAKKSKKAKSAQQAKWQPSAFDAMNLASLRYYAMEIEQVSISVYAGDDKDRTKFNKLVVDLADFLILIRAKYKGVSPEEELSDECYDSWVLCSGMCVPPDQCQK
jgi:hypothetical protein